MTPSFGRSYMKLLNCVSVLTAVAGLSVPPIIAVEAAETAKAMLKDAKGQDVGSVSFIQTPAGVLLWLSLKDVPAGEHAFHIHAVGKCEPPGFESAGGHFNPANSHHGMMSGPGHAGDMPNLHVPASGTLDLEALNASMTLAVVIHAGKDDYTSDPAGNAGGLANDRTRLTSFSSGSSPASARTSPRKDSMRWSIEFPGRTAFRLCG
jgi:Cu-Zn family superoxide dismutase